MAQTVLLEHNTITDLKRGSRNLSFAMMSKSQKFSKFTSGFVPDYRHAVETIGESEGFGSSGRVDPEDSSAPKRKCISLNMDKCDGFNVQRKVFTVSKMSTTEKRELATRLRIELEQIQTFQKKLLSRSMSSLNSIALSSSEDVLTKQWDSLGQNGSSSKHNVSRRFEVRKQAPPTSLKNYVMLMKQCEMLLKSLMLHRHSWVFNTPVDVVKFKIPDYHNVIKLPMDLGTVKTKISSGIYTTPWDFLADVRLTFTNAMTYNPPGNNVHIMARTMSKFFETRWKTIEKKLTTSDGGGVKRVAEEVKLLPQPKKRKTSLATCSLIPRPEIVKPKMTVEEKRSLSRRLESLLSSLPNHIIEFLRRHSNNSNQVIDDEIETHIDSLCDETLFELRKLLDDYLQAGQHARQSKMEPSEVEVLNVSGLSNSSMHHNKAESVCAGNELAEEDVDIGGNDPPISSYPPVEIEKDTVLRNSKCTSSSNSSSDSGSSSSDSDTGSSSRSESDVRVFMPAKIVSEENTASGTTMDQGKSNSRNPQDKKRCMGAVSDQQEKDLRSNSMPLELNEHNKDGENAPSEKQVSPEKQYRAAVLINRFADTIIKAREKTLDQVDKRDPEDLQRQREEIEKQQREERARLQAEVKAAEDSRRRAEAEAAAEAKRKRELEREAARQALLKMEKTVEINENTLVLKDLEMLQSVPVEHIPSSVDETSPDHSLDGMGGFKLGESNPLEQLGLYMKADDEEDEEIKEEPNTLSVAHDVEEGEID